MTSNQIIQVLKEAALALRQHVDPAAMHSVEVNKRSYSVSELPELKRDLIEAGRRIGLLMLEYNIPKSTLPNFLKESAEPVFILKIENGEIAPVLLQRKQGSIQMLLSTDKAEFTFEEMDAWQVNEQGEVPCMVIMPYKSIVSEYNSEDNMNEPLTPTKRLFRLLASEKREIFYILVYALIIGLVSLILPLGLQTTVELISGGVFFSSVYVLIGLVILGVMVTGVCRLCKSVWWSTCKEECLRRRLSSLHFVFPGFERRRLRIPMLRN